MFETFPLFELLQRFFRRDEPKSGASARNRLQLVLIQDRANVCPELLDSLRTDLIALISKYMVIDEAAMSVELERKEGAVALAACIPVLNIRRTQPDLPHPTETYPEEASVARSLAERQARLARRQEQLTDTEDEEGQHGAD